MADDVFDKTPLNRVRRMPERGAYDRESVYAIVDEALICHVGFADGDQPFVIPTIHARDGDALILHGAPASRLLKHAQAGRPMCVTVTLVDGLVLARSAFHSSMNYRSAVLFGAGRLIEDPAEKLRALELLTEHVARGRWADVRPTTPQELAATSVVAMAIESASAKVRAGPPGDDAEDYDLPIWAGVLPLALTAGMPVADPKLRVDAPVPDYVAGYRRGSSGGALPR